MNNNLQELLQSELHNALSYGDRVLHAVSELSDLHTTTRVRKSSEKLGKEILAHAQKTLLNIGPENFRWGVFSPKSVRNLLRIIGDIYAQSAKLYPSAAGPFIDSSVTFINIIYQHIRTIHTIAQESEFLDIQLPRIGLAQESHLHSGPKVKKTLPLINNHLRLIAKDGEVDRLHSSAPPSASSVAPAENSTGPSAVANESEEMKDIPQYHIDLKRVLSLKNMTDHTLHGIQEKREQRYQVHLREGHEHAFHKRYPLALEHFQLALNYVETAEIATLLGWTYGLLGKDEKAKNYCLKAITLDPDYGPPYNDMGSLLLHEGKLTEALKWFELAKRSAKYQNREYPFINAGRGHMMLKNYPQALEEFSSALAIAPHNQELHQTVERLKKSLLKGQAQSAKEWVKDSLNFKVHFDDRPPQALRERPPGPLGH